MNSRLLRKYIRESLGREIMISPERLRPRGTGGEQQRALTVVETIDKTNLSDEEVLEELIVAAGPDTYIRFERKYGDLEFPPLKVSPEIKYYTPHGIYGYPLNQVNVENLVRFGTPTSADFATDYGFFHIYKLDKSRTVNVSKGDNDENQIAGRYTTEKKVIDDIAECVRIISYMFHESKHKPPVAIYMSSDSSEKSSILKKLEQDIANLGSANSRIQLDSIFNKYKNYVLKENEDSDTSKKLIETYKQEIAASIFKYIKARMSTDSINKNSSKQFLLFKILKSSIRYIVDNFGYSEGIRGSQYYSLLLKAIGITGITDLGTSTIHGSEPSQAVSFDFSGDTIKPIGTFKNIFKNANLKELKVKFDQILEGLAKTNIVNWTADFTNEKPIYDYENISLKYFKILIKHIKNNFGKLKGFVNSIAEKNNHSDVLSYIYDNKESLGLDGIKDGLFSSLSDNEKLPDRVSNEIYKVFVKDNINESNNSLRNKLGFEESFFAINFVSSPALTKEAMLDIVEKTKSEFTSFAIQGLKVSEHLDREVSLKIIKKFGMNSLIHNTSAPLTDYYLAEAIEGYNLFEKKITSFSGTNLEKVVQRLCDILKNPHVKDKEIKYIILKLSPLLKKIGKLKCPTSAGFYNFDKYVYILAGAFLESQNVTSSHLEAATLTKEEKINILKIFTFIPWQNHREMNQHKDDDGFVPDDDEDISYNFDMLDQGLKFLEKFVPYDADAEATSNIQIIFSDAYEYFVNAKKYGIG
jgi:hypothetical protein